MTMPTRPAPAPPRLKGQNAAINANVTLHQLHLLQQQQQQLEERPQHNVTVPKLTIKLPPPPDSPIPVNSNTQNNNVNSDKRNCYGGNGSKSRTFIQTRYTPTTDWNGSVFEGAKIRTANGNNGGHKKVPPPRPPPPRNVAKKGPLPTIQQSTNILSNMFQRKKSTTRSITSNAAASRIYSSATYGGSKAATIKQQQQPASINWDAAWNTSTATNALNSQNSKEPQLISFDSPPSSPTFTQKSNSDCLSVDSFSSDSNFSSPNYGSASQPESGFEDDFNSAARSRPATTSPRDPWESVETSGQSAVLSAELRYGSIGTAHVRNLNTINSRIQASDDNPLCNGKSLLPPVQPLHVPTIIKPKISQKPKAPKPPVLPAPGNGSIFEDWPKPSSPPMPKFAPPSPPTSSLTAICHQPVSLLDVITGKIDALQLESSIGENVSDISTMQPYGISIYSFDGHEEGDLSFRENEKIYLLEQVNDDWLRGHTRAGCEGIFPANYIEIKVPLHKKSSDAFNTDYTISAYKAAPNNTDAILKAKCLYNFPAEVNGDLELKENDIVTILYRINEDWLYGELNSRQGQFPVNFLENVPLNIPTI